MGLGCNNIIFKLSVVDNFSKVGPVVQLGHFLLEGVIVGGVTSGHVAEPAWHWLIRVSAVLGGAEVELSNGG